MSRSTGKKHKNSSEKQRNKTAARLPALKEKNSVIVLAVAAAIFLIALFRVHSEDILNGANEIFADYTEEGEIAEYETGRVTGILSEKKEADETAEGAFAGEQELSVVVKSGRYKGETMVVKNFFGPLSGVPVSAGDNVTINIRSYEDGERFATVYEFNRIPVMAFFLILFFIVVVLIGGRKGLKSLVGLIITFICLFAVLIPLLLKGAPVIFTTFIVCAYISLVCFTILGGIHRKTVSAFLGTISGTLLAMIFALIIQHFAKIDGLRLEDAEALLQLKRNGAVMGIKGLLAAGIIISALGAVMDVAMSISSALEEVHAANPFLSRKELFRSGMNIGRDMVGTMTNTLILAFLGSEFTLMIFLFARELTFVHLFSTAFISLETISGISASTGMILSIPLTAFISSSLIRRR